MQVISDASKFGLPDLTDFCYRQAYIANKNMRETGPGENLSTHLFACQPSVVSPG